MCSNKLMIAAAGSGKTTFLVKEACEIKNENILITTYTEANEAEIRKKFIRSHGFVPPNITIQTWFSFLLQHGVRPYQSVIDEKLQDRKIGFRLMNEKSGKKYDKDGKELKNGAGYPCYWGKDYPLHYYFTSPKKLKLYSDKMGEFVFLSNNEIDNEVINRISRIYPHIFVDEVQDLAGWELEILKLLLKSNSNILLVGDPRQVTYLTHHPAKHKPYKDGGIKRFIEEKFINTRNHCEFDETTLLKSHRNNEEICKFSSALYPEFTECEPCSCLECRSENIEHRGLYLVRANDIESYRKEYPSVVTLREKESIPPEWNYGKSKGQNFKRVLIYPTLKIRNYLKSGDLGEIESIRAKFYVAITRAKYSVGIVCEHDIEDCIEGVNLYVPKS